MHFLTQSLFKETIISDDKDPMFTLKDQDDGGLPSLYRLYMESNDIYEQQFAKKYIPGGVRGWDKLSKAPFFQKYIKRWRLELETQIKAEALLNIRTLAQETEGATKYQVNKFLLEGKWNPHQEETVHTGKPGRPSTKKNKQAVIDQADTMEQNLVQEHWDLLKTRAN